MALEMDLQSNMDQLRNFKTRDEKLRPYKRIMDSFFECFNHIHIQYDGWVISKRMSWLPLHPCCLSLMIIPLDCQKTSNACTSLLCYKPFTLPACACLNAKTLVLKQKRLSPAEAICCSWTTWLHTKKRG